MVTEEEDQQTKQRILSTNQITDYLVETGEEISRLKMSEIPKIYLDPLQAFVKKQPKSILKKESPT